MLNFPYNNFPKNKEEREKLDAKWDKVKISFKEKASKEVQVLKVPEITLLQNGEVYPISQKKSEFSEMKYGYVDTIGIAGCGPLAIEYALRLMNFRVSFKDIVRECILKGYRAYMYDESGNIIDGCGTEYEIFDNLANRLISLREIIKYLQAKSPVTLLVENSKYHEDKTKKGNHFVTIIGIDKEQNAIIMDGNLITKTSNKSMALKRMSLKKLVASINLAWGWKKEKVESYLC